MYTCEWKYTRDDAVTIITKIPESEYDPDRRIEQVNSKSGYGFNYHKTLAEAVAESLVPIKDITFVNVPQEEIDAVNNL